MPRSAHDSFPFGVLVLCAEDMYDANAKPKFPPADPRIATAGWDVVAYICGSEPDQPERADLKPGELKQLRLGDVQVFFGFIARKRGEDVYAAAIRGTSGFVEWMIDADFVNIDYDPSLPGTSVEQGFFGVYNSFEVYNLKGALLGANFVDGALAVIGAGEIVVSGHSLGAALATYASLGLARVTPDQVDAVLFASPRTGNAAFAHYYDVTLKDYTLFNYSLDIVPRVPFTAPGLANYTTLPKAIVIGPHESEADIKVDIACSHYLVDYLAMLDYPASLALPGDAGGGDAQQRKVCVLGPRSWSLNDDLASVLSFALRQLENETVVKALAKRIGWTPV